MASKANSRAALWPSKGYRYTGHEHKRAKIVLFHKLAQGGHVIHVKVFRLAAARVACKECKGIGAN